MQAGIEADVPSVVVQNRDKIEALRWSSVVVARRVLDGADKEASMGLKDCRVGVLMAVSDLDTARRF